MRVPHAHTPAAIVRESNRLACTSRLGDSLSSRTPSGTVAMAAPRNRTFNGPSAIWPARISPPERDQQGSRSRTR
jgi:hypothetical protein